MDPTEYKVAARETRPTANFPLGSIKTHLEHRRTIRCKINLDTEIPIQGCVKTWVELES